MQDPVVAQIALERAELLAFLQRLDGNDWSRTTVCAPWTVKDVLAHLVEGELSLGRVYRREPAADEIPEAEAGIQKWRALPGVAVRAALWQHGTATQRVLEVMTEDVWHAPVNVLGCTKVSQLVRIHLFDLAVHGHDLTDALGAAPIWGARLPFLVEFVVRAAPSALRRNGVAPEGAIGIAVGERRWVIDGRSGSWVLSKDTPELSVTAEPDDLVLLATGRASPEMKIEGDQALAARILGAWRVV